MNRDVFDAVTRLEEIMDTMDPTAVPESNLQIVAEQMSQGFQNIAKQFEELKTTNNMLNAKLDKLALQETMNEIGGKVALHATLSDMAGTVAQQSGFASLQTSLTEIQTKLAELDKKVVEIDAKKALQKTLTDTTTKVADLDKKKTLIDMAGTVAQQGGFASLQTTLTETQTKLPI